MKINSNTKLFAVIGNPVKHSKSPLIHNVALEDKKIDAVYMAFEIKSVENAIVAMKELDIKGYSVTIPHKIEVMKYLDEIDELAKSMGAVNTVHNKEGKLVGYNTDCMGAINALKTKTELSGKKVYLIGAGGASRAITAGLASQKANIVIFDLEEEKANELAKEFGAQTKKMSELDNNCDILINATPVGMFPKVDNSVFPKELLKKEMVVFDVVYNPLETKLIKDAKEVGCEIVAGIEMFLEQAYAQFEIWNEVNAPKEIMRKVLIDKLVEEAKNM
jgi:shikimate dehydrogenase